MVGVIVLGALLLAVFLGILAVVLWQEARSLPGPREYLMDEAVGFVHARLPEETRRRLGEDDILRILEWQVLYLQGHDGGGRVRVAGGPKAARYIRDQAAFEQGVEYRDEEIRAVLVQEARYLAAIGAVGRPLYPQEDPS